MKVDESMNLRMNEGACREW